MHEELVDTQFLFYAIITVVDVIAFVCCVWLAQRETHNNVIYRIGLVILSFGLLLQLVRNGYWFAKVDLPMWLSMTWGLKDIGIVICLALIVFGRVPVTHNSDK